MDFTCIFFGVLFTMAGFVFACGKGHIHLSAWKNMPQSAKDKIKISPPLPKHRRGHRPERHHFSAQGLLVWVQ